MISATPCLPRPSPVAQLVKNPPAMQETPVRFLSRGDSPGEGIGYPLQYSWAFLVAQLEKNLPAVWKTWVQSLGWEDSPGEGKGYPLQYSWASLMAQLVKNPPAVWKTWVQSLGWDRLQKGTATHSSILAWKMPGTV